MNANEFKEQIDKLVDYARCRIENGLLGTLFWNVLTALQAFAQYIKDNPIETSAFVLKTTKVNGHELDGDIQITKIDVGLDQVLNVDTTTTQNINDSVDKRFLTDEQRTLLNSGTLATTSQLNSKVDKTITVNGQPLSSNVTISKTTLGLSNVDNTSDAQKPVSTAQQTALNGKENLSNKSNDSNLGTSTTLYPTQNAVKFYTDDKVTMLRGEFTDSVIQLVQLIGERERYENKSTDIELGTSDILYPTQNAVKTYLDNKLGLIFDVLDVVESVGNKSNDSNLGTSAYLYPTQGAVKTYVDTEIAKVVAGEAQIPEPTFSNQVFAI